MRSKMFDEFDALTVHLLPELDVPILTARDNEIGAKRKILIRK